ncbi:hypothetical protein Pmani_031529 [Petrolisthes manimaculis]|uniref:Uncharacterized protein n=1 Tax=Petrolisthes manimaculis TaxID=1843537 RepID=A0AAE1TSJ5_9EUCA|nr:hypothetical protein Pmani_031529 [Petrolisthes manimaculis]
MGGASGGELWSGEGEAAHHTSQGAHRLSFITQSKPAVSPNNTTRSRPPCGIRFEEHWDSERRGTMTPYTTKGGPNLVQGTRYITLAVAQELGMSHDCP